MLRRKSQAKKKAREQRALAERAARYAASGKPAEKKTRAARKPAATA
ncbi:MAG: hypothetical protein R3A48_26415 [Polyangiales bacterium]